LTDIKNYADFNTVTFQGRIASAKIATGKKGDFLAVTIMSNLSEDKTVTVTFASRNGLMTLFQNGKLPVGRLVTIVGSMREISETYFDKKSGQVLLRKYPQIDLGFEATIPTGGLGPLPASAKVVRSAPGTVVNASVPSIDETPSIDNMDDLEVETSVTSAAVAELVPPKQAPAAAVRAAEEPLEPLF
jgi:hypothetical protein